MGQVPKVSTPRSRLELSEDLRAGYKAAFGQLPTLKTLACAFAQNALEHAAGAAIWCCNYGNVTAAKSWKDAGNDYYTIRVAERLDKVNHPDQWTTIDLDFRAYAAAPDGAEGYWKIIGGRYASVLPLFAAGDTLAAAERLSALNYFTAHVEDTVNARGDRVPGYASNMAVYYQAFMNKIASQLPAWVDPTDPAVCAVPDDGGEMRCLVTTADAEQVMAMNTVSLWEQTGELDDLSPPRDEPNA